MTQTTATMFELADRLLDLRERKEQLSEQLKAVNAEIEEVDRQLAELMLSEEIQSFVRSGRMFYLKTETYVSASADRKPELIQWLKDHGLGDIVQETVHPRTLSATLKEMLEENDELPPDLAELVNVFEKTTVSLRKAK
nr:MAG: hypothetical protein DIU58_17855 [Sphaerobacter thermophilus]